MTRTAEAGRVGLIVNPVSARDVRRVLSDAAGVTLGERVAMMLRILHALGALGVGEVVLMPEREGLRPLLDRQLQREARDARHRLPAVRWLEMPVQGSVADTLCAASLMREQGVRALMVMGGDGTHRAVAARCRDVPIVGISTGTNNAFPPFREVTVTAMATALHAAGRIPSSVAVRDDKCLMIRRLGGDGRLRQEDLALIDVGIFNERILGAKAIAEVEALRTILVTQASPLAVGLSGMAAMLQPLGRHEPGGLVVELDAAVGPAHRPARAAPAGRLRGALAPGLIGTLPVLSWQVMSAGVPYVLSGQAGLLSLDGEREISFGADERIEICLNEQGLKTLDVVACLDHAARHHLLLQDG